MQKYSAFSVQYSAGIHQIVNSEGTPQWLNAEC
jgi:hypothetical protein